MSLLNAQAMTSVNFTPRSAAVSQRSWNRFWLFLATITMISAGLPAYAVNRDVLITTPASAVAGSKITVAVAASTDAGGGEQVGFFHADYTTDGGTTWTPITYSQNDGPKATYTSTFLVKGADAKVSIRVRVAFRGGKAGDVDFEGKPIKWESSWTKWQEPPTKYVHVPVVAK